MTTNKLEHEFAGAEWLKSSLRKELSPLGVKVADILGFVWRGLYHMDDSALAKADWKNERFIRVTTTSDMATWDFNKLTELVLLAHNECVRLSIDTAGPRRLALMFHQRERDGGISQRHPTIEQAIALLQESAYR